MFMYESLERQNLGVKVHYKLELNWGLTAVTVAILAFWGGVAYLVVRAVGR